MLSVEAAVWEETFWPVREVVYQTHYYSVDELKRGSWAFWFNQDDSPVSGAVQRIINSYSPGDSALFWMRIGDWLDFRKKASDRVDKQFDRGNPLNYRVPVQDGIPVGDPENRPDLALEIPALISGDILRIYPKYSDFTQPLGTVSNPLSGTISIPAAGGLGWSEKGHSDFLTGSLSAIWQWYEGIMTERSDMPTDDGYESILPRGKE
jgi:hypothetical protein